MKIASNQWEQLLINPKQRVNGTNTQENQGFSKLLEETQTQAAATGYANGVSTRAAGLLENDSLVGLILAGQKVGDKTVSPDRQLESALDTMEQYAAALGDSSRSLRDIEPLADNLKKTAGQLAELSRSLPEGDPLKGLSNDAAVLATVEAMKFKRGDYV